MTRERTALGFALFLGGCATGIVPPPEPLRPAGVGVLDHGRHSSLVVELPGEGMLRYSYGDWGWYALGRTGVAEGSAALLWPTQGALGRRQLPGPFAPEVVVAQVRVPSEHAVWFAAEAAAVRRLAARLDSIFEANRGTLIYNPGADLEFVHHPEPYWALHNSNQRVAEWVTALGARVEGPAVLSVWELRGPAAPE